MHFSALYCFLTKGEQQKLPNILYHLQYTTEIQQYYKIIELNLSYKKAGLVSYDNCLNHIHYNHSQLHNNTRHSHGPYWEILFLCYMINWSIFNKEVEDNILYRMGDNSKQKSAHELNNHFYLIYKKLTHRQHPTLPFN